MQNLLQTAMVIMLVLVKLKPLLIVSLKTLAGKGIIDLIIMKLCVYGCFKSTTCIFILKLNNDQ